MHSIFFCVKTGQKAKNIQTYQVFDGLPKRKLEIMLSNKRISNITHILHILNQARIEKENLYCYDT
ncbi:MAG: hypothetical protein RHS_4069 [Robinsoniella sp. RHS]|nr:MAG: hypothetical protein RHS_4069 [Robinsoniella sp. RHS]